MIFALRTLDLVTLTAEGSFDAGTETTVQIDPEPPPELIAPAVSVVTPGYFWLNRCWGHTMLLRR